MSVHDHYYVGKLIWIWGDLYTVTKIGEKSEDSNLVPLSVEKVEMQQ